MIRDELGNTLGDSTDVLLAGLKVTVTTSFSDPGIADTHNLIINWGDGTTPSAHDPAVSPLEAEHAFTTPGDYTIEVSVTDDDGGNTAVSTSVTVVDATGASEDVVNKLNELLDDPELDSKVAALIREALDKLSGNNGGSAANGVLGKFEQDNLEAALQKLVQTVKLLLEAIPDSPLIEQLALSAKAIVVEQIQEAEENATSRNDWRLIARSRDRVGEADTLMAEDSIWEGLQALRKALNGI